MEQAPLSWIRKIASEMNALDSIPLFGNTAPFPWDTLGSLLSTCFKVEISIRPCSQEWKEPAEVKKSLGIYPIMTKLNISPLGSSVFFAMPRADVDKFTSPMLYEKGKGKGKPSEIIREGFYHFLLLEVLHCLQQIDPLKQCTLQLDEEAPLPEENCFCIDIETQIDDKTCWGTLIIPASFRKKWVEHFSQTALEYFPSETTKQTELVLGIKTAESLITQKEWALFQPGDFLVLEPGAYDARKSSGTATIHLGSTPLFQIKIKHNKIELLDYAEAYEEIMEDNQKMPTESLQPAEEETISIKDVPLNITIELARFRMSLDRLMHLAPGNFLELPVHPDQGVSLCVNGKPVGKGELVQLGDTLGVRILTIGS